MTDLVAKIMSCPIDGWCLLSHGRDETAPPVNEKDDLPVYCNVQVYAL